MTIHLDRGPFIYIPDKLHPGSYKMVKNPDWNGELPDIITFTDFLRWNYTLEYGRYIRDSFDYGILPLPWETPRNAKIENVLIIAGYYDRIDRTSFDMRVICEVYFNVNGYCLCQEYVVYGRYESGGRSDFLRGIDMYDGKRIKLRNPLDDCLVPIMNKKKFRKTAKMILSEYYPYEIDSPGWIDVWPAEVKKWDHLQSIEISVIVGSVKERTAAVNHNAFIYIVNRENVKWLVEYYEKNGLRWDFDMIVIDELSSFKNYQSQRFKWLRKVRPFVNRRIPGLSFGTVTGTCWEQTTTLQISYANLMEWVYTICEKIGGTANIRLVKSVGEQYRMAFDLSQGEDRSLMQSDNPHIVFSDAYSNLLSFSYGKLFCGECGEPMTRRTVNGCKGEKHKVWTCRDRHMGRKGNGCMCRNVDENELISEISDRIGEPLTEENVDMLKRIFIEKDGISIEFATVQHSK